MGDPLRLGISTCLLGERVRYDGGHKRDPFLTDTLGQYVEWVPVCPEVEAGFRVPRESFRLVGDSNAPRLVTTKTKQDVTERITTWASRRVRELEEEDLSGFVFKSRSPSSGMERVKVYDENNVPRKVGVGLFARAFMDHFPRVPTEEEGRLHDPKLRENFIERVFTLKRWRDVLNEPRKLGNLVDFHTRQKLLILAHSPKYYRLMGKLVAAGKSVEIDQLYDQYERLLMEALQLKTTVNKNVNVLHHILGYFKRQLTSDEKQEVLELIDAYRSGYLPLIVPVTLLNHFVRKYDQPYLRQQTFLNPHPLALKLRNHA